MGTPDYEIIKEIPGYKVILRAVLKNQIQQLVEQLATYSDEESVILTASITDGTLSHLGSNSGKLFLEDHEDVKSQFLGFCLKAHHRKQLEEKFEKERQEALTVSASNLTIPSRVDGTRPWRGYSSRSPQCYMSSQQPFHPVTLPKTTPRGHMRSPGVRHEPYPVSKPPSNLDGQIRGQVVNPGFSGLDRQVIKIEADNNEDETSIQSDSNINTQNNVGCKQQSSSSSLSSSQIRNESSEKDVEAPSESSTPINRSAEALSEGLSLDSDLSNLIAGAQTCSSAPQTPGSSSDTDPNVSVKVEAITESEMDLEITGIELAMPVPSDDSWAQNVPTGLNLDSSGGAVNFDPSLAAEYQDSVKTTAMGYKVHVCKVCGKIFRANNAMRRHYLIHTGEKPFKCDLCGKACTQKANLKSHMFQVHQQYLSDI